MGAIIVPIPHIRTWCSERGSKHKHTLRPDDAMMLTAAGHLGGCHTCPGDTKGSIPEDVCP